MNRRQLIAALAASAFLPGSAAAAPPTPEALATDIALLRRALALHCGLHRYNTPAQMNARIEALSRDFAAAADTAQRYLILSRFLATIRDGHSYANFFNQRRSVAAELFDRPTRVPFHFRWLDRRMVVTAYGRDQLPPGTIVERLNGTPDRDILSRLLPYTRTDGHNEGKRVSLLELRGTESIETFDVFHGLVFGPPPESRHRIEAVTPDGRRFTVELPVISLAQRRAQMVVQEDGDGPIWTWTVRPDGIAVLDMPSWALYNSKWDWEPWLRARLDTLPSLAGLIIDLRGNEGGNDCGAPILARLIATKLTRDAGERRVRFRTTPKDLDPYLDTWDDSFRTLGVDAADLGNGFFRLPPVAGVDWIDPVAPRIVRPVAALVGPVNSSATFQFAHLAKRSRAIRLFGEETGGNLQGTIGGGFFFVRLPASGLEFDLPLIGYDPSGPRRDGGVRPDVAIRTTAADIAAGHDPTMDAAARWISSG
ncbi:S41 family peptidase [Sphingomonas radiodurans]|uniref:S41 family peptidase n=1 Tax=Sphingomonas radiodurans TaxID=2890321 RepID=UPI001E62B610|nr:S41 family peptidase [Sphingomonas radiodurans]WBH17857.1 S41 family peptidase [Sphingomonas radiodurans]